MKGVSPFKGEMLPLNLIAPSSVPNVAFSPSFQMVQDIAAAGHYPFVFNLNMGWGRWIDSHDRCP